MSARIMGCRPFGRERERERERERGGGGYGETGAERGGGREIERETYTGWVSEREGG